MAKRIRNYLIYMEELLTHEEEDWEAETARHLKQIEFFMHERLIHLIVTFMVSVAMVMFVIYFIASGNMTICLLSVVLIILFAFYLRHYYLLENSVQKMYIMYDKLLEKSGINAFKG